VRLALSLFATRAMGFASVGLVLGAAVLGAPTASAAQVSSEPTLVLTPSSGPAGTTARLSGAGWGTRTATAAVTLEWPEGQADAQAKVANGRLSGSITIPSGIVGGTAVTVRACVTSSADDASVSCASADFSLPPPTLVVTPRSGPAGTVAELSGTGWGEPASTPVVTLLSPKQTASGEASIVDEQLTGSITIPSDIAGDTDVNVQACVRAGGRARPSCATARFSVPPRLTVSPTAALPGTTREVGGSWCCFSGLDVTWQSTGAVIGRVRTDAAGAISGTARIPLEAEEGTGVVEVCDGDVDVETCADVSVLVQPPTLRADRTSYEIGAPVVLSGEGWCCPDAAVRVTDTADGREWGDGKVDAAGQLQAQATVPDGSAAGEHELSVCVGERCRTIGLSVLLPPASTAGPTTAAPATSGPSVTTAPTVPPVTTAPNVIPGPTPSTFPSEPVDPDGSDHNWWLVVALATAVGVVGVGVWIARRQARGRRPGGLEATLRPAVHRLSPTPVAIVVTVDPPHTSTEGRSTL
jgi:hypothetical protein